MTSDADKARATKLLDDFIIADDVCDLLAGLSEDEGVSKAMLVAADRQRDEYACELALFLRNRHDAGVSLFAKDGPELSVVDL